MILKKSIAITLLAGVIGVGVHSRLSMSELKKPRYETFKVDNSSYTLVHVAQRHQKSLGKDSPKEKREVIQVQSEIYSILERFIKFGNTNIYHEGITVLFEDDHAAAIQRGREKYTQADLLRDRKNILYEHGAATLLALEGKVALRASEDFVAHLDGKLLLSMPRVAYEIRTNAQQTFKEFIEQQMYTKREDSVLEIIDDKYCNETNSNHLLVYGASHDFKDNIERWNTLHPDKKFSLIKIIPHTLAKKSK